MPTQMAETPRLNYEDSQRVLEDLKRLPTPEHLQALREKYAKVNSEVRRERNQ